ncbi:3,4-dihydroxy-2-butanone-4-phosphate synthase [Falsarthrobacter nasiphocae]|uniref:Multifunctional fusion protein n=1 Tax=Falsarthrobacter nasiphocae TaxID=189863 RepID=A0AAE4C796_9MICC|nr:3,4-dihydroxy-2-butanone-4-phosphate synthase [Falsarthrobacter nasiphocae]MDR6891235.1 3,4-dihydroxy 2-butanone 4-phosphate synthase/GTP cyclohydrolase II [Falsarthrobacter nasiphocae]
MTQARSEERAIALDPVEDAIEAMRAGRMVVVVDDEDRENEGDIIVAADAVTPEIMGFMIRYTSGVLCVPMSAEHADALSLPPMVVHNEDRKGTAYTVSCDAVDGVTTGISGEDRALTARVLARPEARPTDLARPGHMFPLRGVSGGVLARRGHTEASIDLAALAGREPVAVIAELNHDDGTMMRLPALRAFADEHGMPLVSIEDLVQYRERHENEQRLTVELRDTPSPLPRLARTEPVRLPTAHGEFEATAWRQEDGVEHLSLTAPRPPAAGPATTPPLVRVHSECLTGDVFGSHRCDCGEQLDAALSAIREEGGTVVYVRGHEGRGIGLFEKIRAYALQDEGQDTVDANLSLGFPPDARDYAHAAAVLHGLGLTEVVLMTNNPEKTAALSRHGIVVAGTRADIVEPRPENERYLRTKAERMNHALGDTGR